MILTLNNGITVITCIEKTTRNARRMKYYTLHTDTTTYQLTKDVTGKMYLDGVEVVDKVLYNELTQIISSAVKGK
jgi:hypothetical protein